MLDIWPENADVWQAWLALKTQWRIVAGMGGTVYQGLDYAAVPGVLRLLGIKRRRRRDVFDGLREMEHEALQVMNQADD